MITFRWFSLGALAAALIWAIAFRNIPDLLVSLSLALISLGCVLITFIWSSDEQN
jgi:hypothetical protein